VFIGVYLWLKENMKVLFISSSRIGDAVLSSGLLKHIKQAFPGAEVTIACGPLVISLFEGYPLLDKIIPLKKEKHGGHWVKLVRALFGVRWDMIIDLRDSAASRVMFGKRKFVHSRRINKSQHKVEQCADVMKLKHIPTPTLWLTGAQKEKAQMIMTPDKGAKILGVGPTANWIGKTWPPGRFIEIVAFMTGKGGVMEGARVAVFGAPGEKEGALKVLNSIPEEQRIDCIAKGSPGDAAAMISLCDFYIGNDSGLMHCAAAAGVPTLGLFGPSYDVIYRPYGQNFIRTPESFDELIDYEGYSPASCTCLMESLTVDMVKEAIVNLKVFKETQ